MTVISVYAVFANTEEATRIGRAMVEARLAACVNILAPVRSIYRWQGTIESADEAAAIFKTSTARVDALIARIAEMHSYEMPCIAAWPIDRAFGAYAQWVEDSTA